MFRRLIGIETGINDLIFQLYYTYRHLSLLASFQEHPKDMTPK